MCRSSFKYNLTFIVLFFGITLVHASCVDERVKEDKIKLYYADWSAPCRTVKMIGKILGITFEEIFVNLQKHDQYKPDFVKMNPQSVIPTINDNGFILWESRAISVYLVQKYGKGETLKLFPEDLQEQANVNKMLQFDMSTLSSAFINLYSPWMFFKTPKSEYKKDNLKTALEYFEQLLVKEYAAGDSLTVADVTLVANILNIQAVGEDITIYPKITAWLTKCEKNMKGFHDANDKGIQLVKEMTQKRKEEESNDLVDVTVSNHDILEAVSTLLRAVQTQVISAKYLEYLKPLMYIVTPFV